MTGAERREHKLKRIMIAENHPKGYLRTVVAPYLSNKVELIAPLPNEFDLYDSTAWEPFVRENQIDSILFSATHLRSRLGPQQEYFHNMQLFLNACNVSHLVEKVIYLGGGAEFDRRQAMNQIKEDDFGRAIPISEHGLSKYTMNLLAHQSNNIYNLRMFSVYGEREVWDRSFLNNACCKAVFDLPIVIDANHAVDYLYMPDLGPVIEWFLNHIPRYHDYNVCSGKSYMLNEIAEVIQRVAGIERDVVVRAQLPERNFTADNSRLLAEMGTFPRTELETGVAQVYRYFSEHKDEVDYSVLVQDES